MRTGITRSHRPTRLAMAAMAAAGVVSAGFATLDGPIPASAQTTTTYYFHGTTSDQANKVAFMPSATFDTSAPTGTTPSGVTQAAEWPNDGPDFAESIFDNFWLGSFSGTVGGSISFDWYWSSTDAIAVATGANVIVTVFADPTAQTATGEIAQGHFKLAVGATPTENHTTLNLGTSTKSCPCTINHQLLIEVSTTDIDPSGTEVTTYYDSTAVASSFSVTTGVTSTPTPTGTVGGIGPQRFDNYANPLGLPHGNEQGKILIGEPSLGVDWVSNATMYAGDLETFRIGFDYTKKPPAATWTDVAAPLTSAQTLDTRLLVDHTGASLSTGDRTFVTTLTGPQSEESYSNDDGASWMSATGGGFPSGVDHESIAAGPYAPATGLPTPLYPHALYYCSQADAAAFCARSDTGGAAWGAGVPIYSIDSCGGLHGKPAVGPDGTVYVPNKDCSPLGNPQKGVVISKDNGLTWNVVLIPNTTYDTNQSDSDVAVGGTSGMGTVYYAYRDGDHHAKVVVSTDDGATWSTPFDIGAAVGVKTAQFPEVIAGDQNRAAVTFIGTTTPGNDVPDSFTDAGTGQPAVWYLYIAFTYDGGQTWDTVNATPNDPVQRGGVCLAGINCSGNDRNMLDFNDATIDNQGRVQVAYTDGCSGSCETDVTGGTSCPQASATCTGRFSSIFSMVDQVCGMGLFAANDPGFFNDPACATPTAAVFETSVAPLLLFSASGAAVGVGLLRRRRRRSRREIGRASGW